MGQTSENKSVVTIMEAASENKASDAKRTRLVFRHRVAEKSGVRCFRPPTKVKRARADGHVYHGPLLASEQFCFGPEVAPRSAAFLAALGPPSRRTAATTHRHDSASEELVDRLQIEIRQRNRPPLRTGQFFVRIEAEALEDRRRYFTWRDWSSLRGVT